MAVRDYQVKCWREYKSSVGLPLEYGYLFGNPVNVLVPVETAINGIMIVGAYPSAKFYTINGITDVPLYDNDAPFSSESYFDGSRVRSIPSGKELEDNYLAPLQIGRNQCWITDLVKVFLFKDGHVDRYRRLGQAAVTETRSQFRTLAERSLKWLVEEIDIASPKVVISLGLEVTSVLFGITEAKSKALLDGAVHPLLLANRENKVICLPHPGIIMKRSSSNPWPQRFEQTIRPNAAHGLKRLGF